MGLIEQTPKQTSHAKQCERWSKIGKSSESVQVAMLKACDACADMGQW